jgi:hypothetical protein
LVHAWRGQGLPIRERLGDTATATSSVPLVIRQTAWQWWADR